MARSRLMRVDPEFHAYCKSMGISRNVTKQLANESTILSEIIENDEFNQEVKKLFKEFKRI